MNFVDFLNQLGVHYFTRMDFIEQSETVAPPRAARALKTILEALAEAGVNTCWLGNPKYDWDHIDVVWDWHSGVDLRHLNSVLPGFESSKKMLHHYGVSLWMASRVISPRAVDSWKDFLITGPQNQTRSVAWVNLQQ